jgi:hypothetical protein
MKTIYLVISLILVCSTINFAQMGDKPPHHMREKIKHLEKIKLIETLDMDEETTLRFFSRKNGLQNRLEDLSEQADQIINQMETIFKAGKVYTEEELKSLINEVNTIHTEMEKEKADFINSLDDILTTEQIAKFIIFERRFKNELRNAMFKKRKHKNAD